MDGGTLYSIAVEQPDREARPTVGSANMAGPGGVLGAAGAMASPEEQWSGVDGVGIAP
jgi:hypothetical protein